MIDLSRDLAEAKPAGNPSSSRLPGVFAPLGDFLSQLTPARKTARPEGGDALP